MRCGVGDYTALLARQLANFEKVAILTDIQARPIAGDENIEVLPVVKKWNLLSLNKVISSVRAWKPDLVHIQFPTAGYGRVFMPNLLPFIFKLLKFSVIQTWHEPPQFSYFLNSITDDTIIVVDRDIDKLVFPAYRSFFFKKKIKYIPIASNIPRVVLADHEKSIIRKNYLSSSHNLIAYFGSVFPIKGVDMIFDIADPEQDRIVLICDLTSCHPYQKKILLRINEAPWAGKVFITGFLPADTVARILAAADAAVFPFRKGASCRNGSLLAAKEQGTFILTTHRSRRGFDESENIYYSAVNDLDSMRRMLRVYVGRKRSSAATSDNWSTITESHLGLYRDILNKT
jgi:glycosyltransferase involved in cell wall biosynthesis